MTVMTVGSFQFFTEIVTLICNLRIKAHVSQKTLIFIYDTRELEKDKFLAATSVAILDYTRKLNKLKPTS